VLSEGDVEFAAGLSSGRSFLMIDNAAEFGARLENAIGRIRDLRANVCVVLGERMNEWRQSHIRIPAAEFVIEPLSDGEVFRLLDCLARNNALGQLASLSPDLRVAAVKSKYKKELLVAMREVTEDKAFDAIIEDEFRNIGSDTSRTVYGAVSGFYRLRAFVRDQVLAGILGMDLVELYRAIADETEGVVEFECIDDANEIYAARARHHVIAQIVWERCLEQGERERLTLVSLEALNINYVTDARAFESFIQADDNVGGISSFEDKVRFFEAAAAKDPSNPYVRQHYARMLRKEERYDLALRSDRERSPTEFVCARSAPHKRSHS